MGGDLRANGVGAFFANDADRRLLTAECGPLGNFSGKYRLELFRRNLACGDRCAAGYGDRIATQREIGQSLGQFDIAERAPDASQG